MTDEQNGETNQERTGTIVDPIENMSDIINRVSLQQDEDRLRVGTSMVNTFNFAVRSLTNRIEWQLSDYRAFCIAMSAIDQIGKVDSDTEHVLSLYRS